MLLEVIRISARLSPASSLSTTNECLIELGSFPRYICHVIKRLLLALLLSWTAIAPAIANYCVVECEGGASSMHSSHDANAATAASEMADCHDSVIDRDDSNSSNNAAMELGCLVATAASLPSSAISLIKIDLISEQRLAVLLPLFSFQTSAPIRPPQA